MWLSLLTIKLDFFTKMKFYLSQVYTIIKINIIKIINIKRNIE